jgi:hypothetical protein
MSVNVSPGSGDDQKIFLLEVLKKEKPHPEIITEFHVSNPTF